MTLSREILVDLAHASDVASHDTSAVWKLTAADSLESIARRIREEVAGIITPKETKTPKL